jgi:hypothetical protein
VRRRFFSGWPRDWADRVAAIGAMFHFPAAELWEMEAEDLDFWIARAEWVVNEQKKAATRES